VATLPEAQVGHAGDRAVPVDRPLEIGDAQHQVVDAVTGMTTSALVHDRLDVVSVGVQHEGAVVAPALLGARPGISDARPAVGDGSLVEGLHGVWIANDVEPRSVRRRPRRRRSRGLRVLTYAYSRTLPARRASVERNVPHASSEHSSRITLPPVSLAVRAMRTGPAGDERAA
jgi:hypothetical protein